MNLANKFSITDNVRNAMFLVLGTKILDVESTIPIVTNHGSSGELNPIMRAVIEEVGINGFRATSYLAATGFAYLLRESPDAVKWAAGVQAYLAFHNIAQYTLSSLQQIPIQ